MNEGEVTGAPPKAEELVGEVQEAPIDLSVAEAEAKKAEAEALLEAAKKAQAERDAKLQDFVNKVKAKAKEVKGSKINDELMHGHFTKIMTILNGRRCPNVVIELLARCGELVDRFPEYVKTNYQNAIDHAARADYYNRLDAKKQDEAVQKMDEVLAANELSWTSVEA